MINPPPSSPAKLSIKLPIKRHIDPLGKFSLSLSVQIRLSGRQLFRGQEMGVLPFGDADDLAFFEVRGLANW